MRIATYNVEWFNALFDDEDRLLADSDWSARYNVTRADQAEALGIVFTALDADAVLIVEAPDSNGRRSTVRALENFATTFDLRTTRAVSGFSNDTQQELALLYDPAALGAAHDPQGELTGKKGASGAPRFDGAFRWDIDVDRAPEIIRFSKPPLELAMTPADGRPFRMIGVHLKSKAPHGAETPQEIMRLSIENRRKQMAQCIWLRHRIETHLEAGDPLIVLGDLNDGPGLDEYEKLFGRSGIEVVMGIDGGNGQRLHDPHARAAILQRLGPQPSTARFFIQQEGRYLNALLDYVMLSRDLCEAGARWRIWHPFDDPVCYRTPELREALLAASDHFPVSVDLDI
ncbi:endonuclease [Maritimibacter sp. 55A14]|uniref:endonuclease/exonuclease/phosphatase family protein n=1 Tax=Maritimibacter sp. 55A14 TaxID=2174844 RepID=UPI000D60E1BB|nr:endonuclease/exonuclease/phosphatase family protein [Maritimibacter sp. 55A14]PWE33859.1 endonuclease [Maritimibacter sp. 55A14]